MSPYAIPADDPALPKLLTSADIDRLFTRSPGWFDRDRVRKRLYAKGFPHPCETARWSPVAVRDWMAGAGKNPGNVPPNIKAAGKPRRRRTPASSGYAQT